MVCAATATSTVAAITDAPPVFDPELQEWNPMEDEWESQRNMYGCDVDNAGVAIDGFISEQKAVCKYFGV